MGNQDKPNEIGYWLGRNLCPEKQALINLQEIGDYVYGLSRQGCSSDKLGNCAICGEFVSDVYLQTEKRVYFSPLRQEKGLTAHKCYSHFGHKECLLSQRRQ